MEIENLLPNLQVLGEKIGKIIRQQLQNPDYLSQAKSITKIKSSTHTSHQIDYDIENILLDQLRQMNFQGSLFSEESQLVKYGPGRDLIVSDPYCNTTLTFSGYRESAVTIYYFDENNTLVFACIVDAQIPRTLIFNRNDSTPPLLKWETGTISEANSSCTTALKDAITVVSLFKPERRQYPHHNLISSVGRLLTVSGGIIGLKISSGEIDAFVDPYLGQPAYEALAYRVAEEAGCIVSDHLGQPIDWDFVVNSLRSHKKGEKIYRQPIVVAANEELHKELLKCVQQDMVQKQG